jgi:hypothetical protein
MTDATWLVVMAGLVQARSGHQCGTVLRRVAGTGAGHDG